MNALLWIVGMIALFVTLFVFYLVAARYTGSHSRRMASYGQTPRGTGASAGTPTTSPISPTPKDREESWFAENLWTILLILVGVGVIIWAFYHPVTVADAVKWRKYWFPFLIVWAVGTFIFVALSKTALTKTLHCVAGAVLTILIVLSVWNWMTEPSVQEQAAQSAACTATRHCDSVEKVATTIPEGHRVCFDPSFWENLPRLGYMTSYKGGPEKAYGCTRDQVIAGTCSERMGDTFRFIPEKDVPLPAHWFVGEGGSTC